MGRERWHILREDGVLTLARRLPPRFDVAAQTVLPGGSKTVLAHQIRQDVWRALQSLRGFSPVVRIEQVGDALQVTAGGQMAHKNFPKAQCQARVADVLGNVANQSRWLRHANRNKQAATPGQPGAAAPNGGAQNA